MKKTRVALPTKVRNELYLWQHGLGPLPDSYIDFHRKLALAALEDLKKKGALVIHKRMGSDGWGDGMRVLQVGLEIDGTYYSLYWQADNQEFFRELKSGGAIPAALLETEEGIAL